MCSTLSLKKVRMEASNARFQGGLIHHFNCERVNSLQKTKDDSRFLNKYSAKSNVISQNYGVSKKKALAKKLATKYDSEGKHTARSFRRVAAATLAESGVLIVALCYSGLRKSCNMEEGCTDHSSLEKSDRASSLDGNAEEPSTKSPRLDEYNTSKASSTSHPSVVRGNYSCISFDGLNDASE